MGESRDWILDPLTVRRRSTPERTGLISADTGEAFSFRALDDAAWAVTDWIRSTSDGTVSTVGLCLDRRTAVAPLVFGGLRAGARVVLLDVSLPASALATRFERVDGDVLVYDADAGDVAKSVDPPRLASLDPSDDSAISRIDPFGDDVDGTRSDAREAAPADGELVAFTSGTTGDPKRVRLELTGLVASAVASALRLGVAADDRWLVPIPTYHVGGLSPVLRCTVAGTTAVFLPSFDAARTIEAIEDRDVTCVSLVPTQLSRMLDAGWEPPHTLRFVLLGGGPIPTDLIERCADRGVPACPTYGTTETASQVATARPAEAVARPGTVGRPLAFSDVTIVDDDGVPADPGTVGEIVVDGPTVTPGYIDADRTNSSFGEYGFRTGDLGYEGAGGRLWIEGRVDDRIVTGGEVVSASAVADAIRAVDGVADVAVVGIEDEEWGEQVGALIETDADLAGNTVREACHARLPDYAVPKTVATTDRLPRTPSGTVDRTLVRNVLD